MPGRFTIRLLLFTVCATALSTTGCVHRGRDSLVRFWADYNTQRAPALYCEKLDHQPYKSVEVESYRWMYNFGPGDRIDYRHRPAPFVEPQDTNVPPPTESGPAEPAPPDALDLPRLPEPAPVEPALPPLPDDEIELPPSAKQRNVQTVGAQRFNRSARLPQRVVPLGELHVDEGREPAVRPRGAWLFGG